MEPTDPGQLIKSIRKDRFWSLRRLAREAGLSPSYLSQLETGARTVTARSMGRIADAFGVPPYELLARADLIPQEDLEEARAMATRALRVPNIASRACGQTPRQKLDWLIVDYLYLIGHDPYGHGWDFGPGGHEMDWTPFAPERMAEAAANPRTAEIQALRGHRVTPQPTEPPSDIEGWKELTEADKRLVQQLVNRLRSKT